MSSPQSQKMNSVLLSLGVLGTLFIWGGTVLDGSLVSLLKAVFSKEPYVLPGTESTLKGSLTKILWPVDVQLRILIVFFWEAVDGSHPTASVLGLYFLGQLTSILTVLYTDSFRTANKKISRLNLTAWLLLFQATGIGCTGPFWAMVYIARSPLLQNLSHSNLMSASSMQLSPVAVLPVSIFLGYILPAALMALKSPDIVSNGFQQKAIAVWNVFPIWTLSVQSILERVMPGPKLPSLVKGTDADPTCMNGLRITNIIMFTFSFAMHWAVVGLSATSVFFPSILGQGYARQFSPGALLLPPFLRSRVETVGDGVRGFFLWDQYFGYTVAILVALWQLNTAVRATNRRLNSRASLLSILACTILAGPGSTCLAISWTRDEILNENPGPHNYLLETDGDIKANGRIGEKGDTEMNGRTGMNGHAGMNGHLNGHAKH